MRLAGDSVPRPRKPRKPKKAPTSGPTPRPRGQSLTQAPALKVPKSRGHAKPIILAPITDTPLKRIQRKQRRVTARATMNIRHAQKGYTSSTYGPAFSKAAPARPLTSHEVTLALKSPGSAETRKRAKLIVTPKKGGGFHVTPAAVIGDVGAELKGSGVLEKGITQLGAMSAAGYEHFIPGKAGRFVGAIPKDTAGLVAGAVPSIYIPTSEAVSGHPGKAANTLYQGVKETVTHPTQHPVSLILLGRGAEGALSRTAGEALRAAPKGSALHRFADTERAPLALEGTAVEQRRYSKGIVENRLQKAGDRRAIRKRGTRTVNVPTRDEHGAIVRNNYVKAINPSKRQLAAPHVLGGKLNRRIDIEAGKGITHLRDVRQRAARIMAKVKPRQHEAVALINEGVIKHPSTVAADLRQHLKQLEIERSGLDLPADIKQNAENIAQTERLLADREFLANPSKEFHAARVYADAHGALDLERHKLGDLTKGQVEARPLLPFAVRELGLRYNEKARRFENPDGHAVSTAAIRQAFEKAGGDTRIVAYVPTKPDSIGAGNFYGSLLHRPGAELRRFTGTAARRGTYQRNYEVLAQSLSNSAVKVARHRSVNNVVNTFGLKQSDGRFFDYEGAQRERAHQEAAGNGEYVAVTVARQTAPDTLVEDLTPAELHQTFRPAEPGDSHVVLFRKQTWQRLEQHEQGRGRIPASQKWQQITQAFRHTVLNLSTKWLTGNGLEAFLRMQINELTPVGVARTIKAGRAMEQRVRALGPEGERAMEELRAAAAQGLFLSQKGLDLHHPEDAVVNFARKVRRSGFGPGKKIGPKGIADLWDGYRNAVAAINGTMELSVFYYALGKEARNEVQSFTGSWLKALDTAGPAYADVAKGLLDSNNVARYAKAVDDIRGRYSNLSPDGRWMVTMATPFAPWYLNSLHFFAVTLPGHHPVKTSVLAAATVGTADERRKLHLPPWAQGIPLSNGRVLPIEHFTPAGIAEDPTTSAADLVLPQISGSLLNLRGINWTGQQLPPGTDRVGLALNTAAETFIPVLTKARQVLERGGKSEPGSTILHPKTKAGTKQGIGQGFRHAFDPFRSQKANPTSGPSFAAPPPPPPPLPPPPLPPK